MGRWLIVPSSTVPSSGTTFPHSWARQAGRLGAVCRGLAWESLEVRSRTLWFWRVGRSRCLAPCAWWRGRGRRGGVVEVGCVPTTFRQGGLWRARYREASSWHLTWTQALPGCPSSPQTPFTTPRTTYLISFQWSQSKKKPYLRGPSSQRRKNKHSL